MALISISDKAIAKLSAATLHELGSAPLDDSQNYVLSLIRSLPWFYRIPIRAMACLMEFSSLPFRLKRFSSLDDTASQCFVLSILDKTPFFPALHRLVRTFVLMDYAERIESIEPKAV